MTVDVSRLGIEVESSGIKEATSDLDRLTQSATKAENATSNLKTSSTSLTNTQKTATSVADSLLQKFQQQVDLLGANTEKTFSYKAASKGLSDQQQAVAAQLGAQVDGYKALIAQQQEAEKASRTSAAAAEAYAKAQGQAIEMNKRFDASQQIAALKELNATRQQEEKALRAAIKAEEDYAAAQGQAIEMNKRFDRQAQATSWRELGKAQSEAIRLNKQYDAAQSSTISTTQRVEAQQRSFIATLKDQAETYKMTASELTAYRAAQLGVSDQAAPFIKKLQDAEQGMNKVGISAKQTAFAFRMLPAQFSDIAVQLAGGQNPFLILLQQGSQIKDSFGGLGNTFKALVGAITPTMIVATALGGALATVAYGAYKGSAEFENFNKQIILTGNFVGLNNERFAQMSIELGKLGGGRNAAAQALTAIAESGGIASDQVVMVGKAAVQMQEITGQAVEKTVAQFMAINKDPIRAVTDLNDKYHFLTLSVFEQITALEQQGKTQEAADVAMRAYADGIASKVPEIVSNLGTVETAWKAIKQISQEAMSAIYDIGRPKTYTEQITALTKQMEQNNRMYEGLSTVARDKANKPILDQIDVLESDRRRVEGAQQRKDAEIKVNDEALKGLETITKRNEAMKGSIKLAREIGQITKSFSDVYKKDPNNSALAGVKFDGEGNPTGGGDFQKQIDNAKKKDMPKTATNEFDISQQLQKYQNLYKLEEKAFKSFSEQMKLQREANTVDEVTYLDTLEQAEQTSLEKRLKILEDEKGVAAKRKNKTQLERINGEIAALEQQLNDNLTKYGLAREKVWTKEEDALNSYVTSLQNAYNLRKRAVDDALVGTTLGDVAKGEMQRRLQLQREFDDKSNELNKQKLKGTISPELYRQESDALGTEYQRRLQLEEQYNKDSATLRGDWTNGAMAALNQYKEGVQDVAGQTKTIFTNAFSGMTDALTDFVMTGKADFGSFARSIIAQIVKMQIAAASSSLFGSILNIGAGFFGGGAGAAAGAGAGAASSGAGAFSGPSLMAANGGVFSGGAPTKFFADGGSFTNGIVSQPTNFDIGQMGEAGPEAIVPLTRTSDGSLGVTMKTGENSAGPVSISNNITINNDGTATSETNTTDQSAQAKELASLMENVSRATIAKEQRQGGLLWKMANGQR